MKGFPEPENVDRSEQTNIPFISCMTGIAFIIEQQIFQAWWFWQFQSLNLFNSSVFLFLF